MFRRINALLVAAVVAALLFGSRGAAPARAFGFKVGVNITSITDYGYPDLRPWAVADEVTADLAEMQRMGATIVRVWVGNDQISDQEAARRLGVFLDTAKNYNVMAIVSFIDFYRSGHDPVESEPYYTDSWNGIPLLGHSFFAGGYQTALDPFIQTVIEANKDRSNIYAWEVGNELKDDSSPATFVSFMQISPTTSTPSTAPTTSPRACWTRPIQASRRTRSTPTCPMPT